MTRGASGEELGLEAFAAVFWLAVSSVFWLESG
jgi:hypothetical protein